MLLPLSLIHFLLLLRSILVFECTTVCLLILLVDICIVSSSWPFRVNLRILVDIHFYFLGKYLDVTEKVDVVFKLPGIFPKWPYHWTFLPSLL